MLDWRELTHLSDEELGRLDIAAVNLACAQGLPGAERIDVDRCLRTLDAWAATVRRYTELAHEQFFRTNPADYDHSEPLFRMVSLALALQRHCGVRYEPSWKGVGPEVPIALEGEFIHGVIQGPGGTCATLPVVYAAVGRRLGYPVQLVRTKQHFFCRWDDPATGIRFNIEASGDGVDSFPDEHYRQWPVPIKDAEEEQVMGYLTTLTPKRELAAFLGTRAFYLRDRHRYLAALDAFIHAGELDREHAAYTTCLFQTLREWQTCLQNQFPPRFPRRIEVVLRKDRQRWPMIPWEVERDIAFLHATEICLTEPLHEERWWGPLRRGRPPKHEVPTSLAVNFEKCEPFWA